MLAIQAGANAYLGVAFGEYLGAFLPFFSSTHTIASIPLGPWTWKPNTAQLAGMTAIAVLSTVNYFGTRQGASVQGALTAIKLLSVAGLIGFGLLAPATASPDWTAPLPPGNLLTAMGLAIAAILGTFDGWYQATLCAGEIKRPERNLPLGMIGGTVLIGVLYLLVNLVYFRALPMASDRRVHQDRRRGRHRVARSHGRPTAGGGGARVDLRLPVVGIHRGVASRPADVGGRAGIPMDGTDTSTASHAHGQHRHTRRLVDVARPDGQLRAAVRVRGVHRHHLSRDHRLALFQLRRQRPDAPRPYRVVGYPWVPGLFVVAMTGLLLNTIYERPMQSLLGVGLVALGVPFFRWRQTRHLKTCRCSAATSRTTE